ncbi:hypothetical protein IAT38_007326 [Cryptococcus sp. DSM 104549]
MSRLPVWTDTPSSPHSSAHSNPPHHAPSHRPSASSSSHRHQPPHDPTQYTSQSTHTNPSVSSISASTARTIIPGYLPSRHRYEPIALTEDSLARLSLGEGSSSRHPTSSPPHPAAIISHQRRSSRRQDIHTHNNVYNPSAFLSPVGMSRVPSGTPSVLSEEEDVEGGERVGVNEEAKSWLDLGESGRGRRREGKGGARNGKGNGKGKGREEEEEGMAGRLPPEILIHILKLLPETKDLLSSLLVSRAWCLCAFSLLWYKPHLPNPQSLASLIRVLNSPNRSLPYANAVRRLHLTQLASTLTDELLLGLASCTKLERLNVTGAERLSAAALSAVLVGMPGLTSADLTGVESVDDKVVDKLARTCAKLQAVNLTDCSLVGDEGVLSLAKNTKLLRRVKFSGCHRITERSLIPLIRDCPHILEYDFQDVFPVTNAVIHTIFLHSQHLRELRTHGCLELAEDCIPSLPALDAQNDDELVALSRGVGLKFDMEDPERDMAWLRPRVTSFESLRMVDMTGCTNLGDKAVDNLVTNAPKLRVLTFTKCLALTDRSLESIGRLGKHLHHLHLGHCQLITDEGVIALSRVCTRLRYIDLACCDLLTDACVAEIGANMPKLRRIGLVKVVKITDEALLSLVGKYASLERLHLSYCDNLTVKGIAALLNRLGQIKHLSLTGVSSFKVPELQAFCRAPPESFNEHQRSAFCVFSGHSVDDLREYLNKRYLPRLENDTSEDSIHGGSETSTSSLTIPVPSPNLAGAGGSDDIRGLVWPPATVNYSWGGVADAGDPADELAYRRGVQTYTSGSSRQGYSSRGTGGILPGIPGEAFMHPILGDYAGLGLPAPGPGQNGAGSGESSRAGSRSASRSGGAAGTRGGLDAHAFFGSPSRVGQFSPPRHGGDTGAGGVSPWRPSHAHAPSAPPVNAAYANANSNTHRYSVAQAANPLGLPYMRSPISGETADSSRSSSSSSLGDRRTLGAIGSGRPGRDELAAQRSPVDTRERPLGPRAPSNSHASQSNINSHPHAHHHAHQAPATAPLGGTFDNTSPMNGYRPSSAAYPASAYQHPARAYHGPRPAGTAGQSGSGTFHVHRGQRSQMSPSASGVTMVESAGDIGPWVHVTRGREGWEGSDAVGGSSGSRNAAVGPSVDSSDGGSGSGSRDAGKRRRWIPRLGGSQGGRDGSSER